MVFDPILNDKTIKETDHGLIYPVYLTSRVLRELVSFCSSNVPKEALSFLLGKRVRSRIDSRIQFTKVTDWVTGSVESTHISANFTTEGLKQANNYLDDKYGKNREKNDELPTIIGIVHSHPFGTEPEFSHTDLNTFLNFPYNAEGNVFILIDPVPQIPFVKVYKIINGSLIHVPWIEYSTIESDLNSTIFKYDNVQKNSLEKLNEVNNFENEKFNEEDAYKPPNIEDIDPSKRSRKKNVNMREFF